MSRPVRKKSVKVEKSRKTLSPVDEALNEKRTPTPEKELLDSCAQKEDRVDEMIQRGNLTCTKYGLTPLIMDNMLAKYSVLNQQIGGPGHPLLDQMLAVTDDLQKDIDIKRRQIRKGQEQRIQMEREASHYRVEDLNYKLSSGMDKAEIADLRCRLKTLDNWKPNRKRMEKKLEEIKKEHDSFEKSTTKVTEETESITRIVNNVSEKRLLERRNVEKKVRFEMECSSTWSESSEMTGRYKVPQPPQQMRGESRRPYTGRTRDGQAIKLPLITENNRVVSSAKVPLKQDGVRSTSAMKNVPVEKPRGVNSRLDWFRMKLKQLI